MPIYNLITPGTIDEEIYDRCLWRIGVFHRALGASEEILGRITREICDIAENMNLTPEERQAKLQQLADNEIRGVQEQEELEEHQAELFGIRLPSDRIREQIEEASSYWLSPPAIQNLVTRYLESACRDQQEHILGEKALKTLRLSQEARDRLLRDFQNLPRQASPIWRDWENWLKGTSPHLAVTFDSACAVENPDAVLLMPVHPLVRQAADLFDIPRVPLCAFCVADHAVPAADYPFVIYQWELRGLRNDLFFRTVCRESTVTPHILHLLEKAGLAGASGPKPPHRHVFDALESQHYALWAEARHLHQERTRQLAAYRKESLTTSHRAQMGLLREQLAKATNDRIQRMRESQIANAEADYARRLGELDSAASSADIIAQPVAFGIIRVQGGDSNGE